MPEISIQDLKARLSSAIAEAEQGRTLLITRHRKLVAQLGPVRRTIVRRGTLVGKGRLTPAIVGGTRAEALAVLLEDRGLQGPR